MIFSCSLSALQVLEKLKGNHPLLIQLQDMLHKIETDQKEAAFTWVFVKMKPQIELPKNS